MKIFPTLLVLATLLCSLVAGFLFAFSTVVMPGIRSLADRDFIRAFQAIDRVIQNNQPLFLLVWIGSAVALIAATAAGYAELDRAGRLTIIGVSLVYVLGVQVPTVAVNVPLNNRLQSLEVQSLSETELASVRADFEPRWNRWNVIRTVLAIITSIALILLVYRV